MGKSLVNMTLLLVQDDIEHILAEQPQAIQDKFVQKDLFPDLIAYVLSRIPNLYLVLEEEEISDAKSHIIHESAERQLQREEFIRQGIYLVLEKSFYTNSPHRQEACLESKTYHQQSKQRTHTTSYRTENQTIKYKSFGKATREL